MRSRQPRLLRGEKTRLSRAFHDYLRLAARYAAPDRAALMITHGLSGCGKTTATQPLVEQLGAVRLRSDLERKRLHGVAPLSSSGSGLGAGIYSREASAATYRRLGERAREALRAGYPVVVDATFLRRAEREAFRAIAEQLGTPFLILSFHAPQDILRARVTQRLARADDASEAGLAVFDQQLAVREPLTPAEMAAAFAIDTTAPVSRDMWRPFIDRFHRSAAGKAPPPPVRAAHPDDETIT
jgi:predicted kinase